jgi:hypothetical protein
MNISFPETRPTIDAIRNVIGRNITFETTISVPCSGCSLDPISGGSTNPFHIPCSGTHYITTTSGQSVMAHITYKPIDNLNWVSGGKLFEGDVHVQIAYTPESISLVDNCDHIAVDGKNFDIKAKELRGAPSINRMVIALVETK